MSNNHNTLHERNSVPTTTVNNQDLSRGVFVKDNPPNQNNYNQDLFGESVLLEIGGPENTLDEEMDSHD
ncbi:stage II sporulation protein P, partial [Neobacillus niacini]|uniref:stage II sporulation protein P n=1 Tax=Neobacillus niacini TaxID=86668 RepID=UPI002FFE7D98